MRAVNLLTPELRSTPKGKDSSGPSAMDSPGGIGAFVLLGALALSLAALAGYVLSNNTVKNRKAELAQVTAQNAATVAQVAKVKPYADFQALAQARAGTVQALAGARFNWEQSLRDLSRAMPKEVYLTALDGTVGGGASSGPGTRASIQSPAIELKGCTKSQPAVAALMSRMRNVQGVTRVALSSSDKDAGGGAAGGSGTVNPCGKGNPPAFELAIFFEGSAVSAALSNATGVPADPAAGAAPAAPAATPSPSGTKPATGAAPTTPPAAATTGGAK